MEKITNYKKFTHGEAIVKGMEFAFKLAEKKKIIDKNYKFFADDVIKKFGFKAIPDYPLEKMISLQDIIRHAEANNVLLQWQAD